MSDQKGVKTRCMLAMEAENTTEDNPGAVAEGKGELLRKSNKSKKKT